jgi:hypothetical protein
MPFTRSKPLNLAVLPLLVLFAAPALARAPLFTLADPRGDDHGDGSYVYPLDDDLDPGDLDLLSLSARAEGDGTMFEATFAKPIRVPGHVTIDDGGTQLDTVARFGFYTLNLDIYIDVDRVAGQGGVAMLPGRHAEVDPATAWERAIILTPRPYEAKEELKRILMKSLTDEAKNEETAVQAAEIEALKLQVPGDVDSRIFFPTKVRVRGPKVSFFVPGAFLGGPAKDTWAYTVAVSGANLLQAFDLRRVLGRDPSQQSLMILPVSPGKWQDRFGGGREAAPNQPPLIDILVPAGKSQEKILADFDPRAKRPAVVPGVVPADQKK